LFRLFARTFKSFRYLAGVLAILGFFCCAAHAQKKTSSAPAPHASAPASHASAPASHPGGSTASHPGGTTTASHGPTTGGSTASHGPTTSSPHGGTTTTTTNHGGTTTTTANHGGATTTTANHGGANTAGGGGKATTAGGGKGTTAGGGGKVATAGAGSRSMPKGATVAHTANGSSIQRSANGRVSNVHDANRNMDIHHNLNGNRRVSVERADHSRVVAERGGRGYVQHPYNYHGREYGRRTYYDHGRYYNRYYGRYGYRGGYLDVYAPGYYYSPGFYGWAYNPWAVPVVYPWGWAGNPWYGYYGAYFTPYAVYPSAAFWLTDYLVAASLQAAYAAQVEAAQTAALDANASPMTPEVKKMIADEVQRQVALENSEAQQNAQNQDIDPGSSGIARMLSDNQPHVFVAGSDLDLVASSGQECAVSLGDVIEVPSSPPDSATEASAVVLTSKGGKECAKNTNVSIAFNDLQDMQNHMRETIDKGMGELQQKQGKDGLPAAPPSAQAAPVQSSFAAVAPPPDPNAAAEIKAQLQEADKSEQEVASAAQPESGVGVAPPSPPAAAPTVNIALGQTVDQVVAAMGQPKSVVDLGTKKIYVYPDMKVTFKAGKVSDVQ